MNQPLLSIAVPCYNSQDYLEKCVRSLLIGKNQVEIILVDDGSKDHTPQICDQLHSTYPDIIKVIHKPNGGHGSGVNAGIQAASGLYFKVVDSDDSLDSEAYRQVLDRLEALRHNPVDLFITNYVYDKVGKTHKKVMQYRGVLPQDRIFTWQDASRFKKGRYLLMHSLIYRTEILRECGLQLPEHTFYVDNLYAYQPLPYIKTLYYLDVDFYNLKVSHSLIDFYKPVGECFYCRLL